MLWSHLAALAVGGAATFGIPVVGAATSVASPESRPSLAMVANRLSVMGRAAITVLILTGLAMIWLRIGLDGLNGWFWVKIGLVAGLIGGVIWGVKTAKKAQSGDAAATALAPRIGGLNMALLVLIILAAVASFG